MLAGLQDQFIPYAEDGTKRHTIRKGKRFKKGMRIDLYAKPRQKGMKLIFRAMVTRVEKVVMWFTAEAMMVIVAGDVLDLDQQTTLFWFDGFRGGDPRAEAHSFWWKPTKKPKQKKVFFVGQMVHWDYANRWTGAKERPDLPRTMATKKRKHR